MEDKAFEVDGNILFHDISSFSLIILFT
jgi:hypothetical protein